MPAELASAFLLIFLAELPDKTALTALTLATRRPALWVWLGTVLGMGAQSALAVTVGSLARGLPPWILRYGSALVFAAFALWAWRRGAGPAAGAAQAAAASQRRPLAVAGEAAVLTFVAEFGDLTQLLIVALAARLPSAGVFAASWLALSLATGLAAGVGQRLAGWLRPSLLRVVTSAVMAGMALATAAGLTV
jgi:putative Ca2+/H+ antiporter (TMEM165/GDT1 family)